MSLRLHFAVAATSLVLAVCAKSSVWAQAIGPTPVKPQAAPAVEPAAPESQVTVEPATGVAITWTVVNRFRLFRDERDFRRHADATRGRTVLEAEQTLAAATDGDGQAHTGAVWIHGRISLL